MKLYSKLKAALLAVFLIVLLMAMPVLAEWSGALIVTGEYPIGHKPLTIYTLALDYAIKDWWYADLVVDTHPALGVDLDIGTTMYLPRVLSKTIYVSAGIRSGVWRSDRPPTPYVSVALRF
ncbi:MAG: hypothetical protein QM401_04970 [Bacillota bacterium]|nr:hypothetical protein [Bacillota bacterium]